MDIQKIIHHPKSFFLIAGPCVVENKKMSMDIAATLKEITTELKIPFIFKASYRKANRTSNTSFTGIGDIKALEILQEIRSTFKVPVITDIHLPEEAALAAKYVDMLQIPAFLCRQSDLLEAAARTGKPVNIKKGQFLSAQSMAFAAQKVKEAGNENILLTERGTFLGYGDLVVDFRSIPIMKDLGYPVILDCTHSLQQPNTGHGVTGGLPQFIGMMAKAGIVTGANGIFIETHPNPAKALSDGANMLPLKDIKELLISLKKIQAAL
ncbi:MAG: 3-deoxy-8-phosphooctulonate synthase [Bacteroidetes bacterium HGW-Bacteroidetes-21]|jgi:2-dehydro-3-deoxyphosphooctonate aldolase (KDO 8-P synthase)|nr:MAG: 3-deoxy-8-phosphooctulonate synthase [Bacteroidetes bacterium HGW-Bacteroidetes-21]